MAFIEILKNIVNWCADPKILITLAAFFLFASLKWPEKFYSDTAAKILFTCMFAFFIVSLLDGDFRKVRLRRHPGARVDQVMHRVSPAPLADPAGADGTVAERDERAVAKPDVPAVHSCTGEQGTINEVSGASGSDCAYPVVRLKRRTWDRR